MRRFLEREIRLANPPNIVRAKFAVLLAEILPQRPEPLRRVDQLHAALAILGLVIRKHPDVGGDARVVEDVEW
jgi:hypothetical protein